MAADQQIHTGMWFELLKVLERQVIEIITVDMAGMYGHRVGRFSVGHAANVISDLDLHCDDYVNALS